MLIAKIACHALQFFYSGVMKFLQIDFIANDLCCQFLKALVLLSPNIKIAHLLRNQTMIRTMIRRLDCHCKYHQYQDCPFIEKSNNNLDNDKAS